MLSLYSILCTTRFQINHAFLFHGVIKILTACRMLKISIARCQIEPEIHSFPTMYIMGGGGGGASGVQMDQSKEFSRKGGPKTSPFGFQKSGST